MNQLTTIGIGVLTGVVTWLGVAAVRRVAERRRILDLPGARSLHTHPVPRGGGLAIVMVCLGALVVLHFVDVPPSPLFAGWVLLGGGLVAGVSWVDDLRSLPALARFSAHVAAAACVLVAVGTTQVVEMPLVGELHLAWLGPPLVLLWVVGLTNAYNFMDGIDGIAGAQAVVAGVGWLLLAGSNPVIAVIGLVLSASSLGFLLHNWPPAKIFMGDVGSAFIGYILAVMTIIARRSDTRLAFVGFLFVWPFVFDTVFTFLRRLRRGENVLAAHRSHLYQRLVIAGFSHQFVTLLYAALAALGVGLARIWLSTMHFAGPIVFASLIGAAASLWGFVWWAEKAPRST
jgi:UDP-N-acetylmuramyl pentapeptide phosphotransferase/UDP-N-acetylglucosamine-1-phosphate transferase